MDEFAPFVSVQLDYSLLSKAFKKIWDKLNEHEEKIQEHNQLIQAKADSFDLLSLKNQENQKHEEVTNANKENSDKIEQVHKDLNNKIIELTSQFDRQGADIADNVIMQLKTEGLIQPTKPDSVDALDDVLQRLAKLESNVQNNMKQTTQADSNIKTLIEKLTALNTPDEMRLSKPGGPITSSSSGPTSNDQPSPMDQIADTVSTVNHKFDTIFKRLPDEDQPPASARSIKNSRENSSESPRSPKVSARSVKGGDTNIQNTTQNAPQNVIYQQNVIHHDISRPYEVDFSAMRPGPSVQWNTSESPDLPPLITFNNLADPIDYIYRLVPTLQGILIGMNDAINQQKDSNTEQISKDTIDDMYNKFTNSIRELANQVIRLSEQMSKLPTMSDLRQAVEGLHVNDLPQTSIGVVHCMTCGREMSQVAGAMSYEEAVKALGRAPTSIATRGVGKGMGVQYTGRSNFDSTICESPRSVRSARASTTIKVTRK